MILFQLTFLRVEINSYKIRIWVMIDENSHLTGLFRKSFQSEMEIKIDFRHFKSNLTSIFNQFPIFKLSFLVESVLNFEGLWKIRKSITLWSFSNALADLENFLFIYKVSNNLKIHNISWLYVLSNINFENMI